MTAQLALALRPAPCSAAFREVVFSHLVASARLPHGNRGVTSGTLTLLLRRGAAELQIVSLARVSDALVELRREGRAVAVVDRSFDRLTETVRTAIRWKASINARQVRYACAALEALGLVSRNVERTANPSGSVREVVRWRRGGRRHA